MSDRPPLRQIYQPIPTSTPPQPPRELPTAAPNQPVCAPATPAAAECPSCGLAMHLWAGFYRCRNCGYKESCCF